MANNLGIWILAAVLVVGIVAVAGSDVTGALTLVKKGGGSSSSLGGPSGTGGTGCYSDASCPANFHCEFTSGTKGRCVQNPAMPDLIVSAIDYNKGVPFPNASDPNQMLVDFDTTFKFKNIGTGTAQSKYGSINYGIKLNDANWFSGAIGSLQSGQEVSKNYKFTMDAGKFPATLKATIDSGNGVSESDEGNNDKSVQVN